MNSIWCSTLLPPSSDMYLWIRNVAFPVKNELLAVVHYTVALPESSHAFCTPCFVLHVGVRVTLHRAHLLRKQSSEMHAERL